MKILLLGSSGFLGSYLIKRLLNYKKFTVSQSQRNDFIVMNDKVNFSDELKKKISQSDVCINCIANTNFEKCDAEKENSLANILIPSELINLADDKKYFIHFSSDIFYDNCRNNSNENSILNLNNSYAVQKKTSEDIFSNANSIIIRTSFLGYNHRNSGLFNHILQSVINNKKIDGWENVYSSSVSIWHIVDLIISILNNEIRYNGIYNFGSNEPYSKFSYIESILKFFNKENLINKIEFKPEHQKRNLNTGMISNKIKDDLNISLPTFDMVVEENIKDLKSILTKK